ncbi:protein CURVATURE THYLAKOID 1A, chloroplastic-like isoform X1 [Syzygium oleosum]|uniref:protein CURVATURE THYLAKOID 1A, chloroplastic-like isoform X1 n=1 Tax=Syzygium oleosum TaxID=219896 RepID=UPI0024BA5823|nr:protein CURVATURE THYLAKOID 1A, chloroplastic-like isoform X1 [Syzygium oleosum]
MEAAYAAAGGSGPPPVTASTRRSSLTSPSRRHVLPHLSPRRRPCSSLRLVSDSNRFKSIQIRASSEETSSPVEVGEMFADLKEKWDAIEDKSRVFLYGGGAIVAFWLSSIVVEAINSVPLLPKVMELVGLGYTGWFVYRYLLFKSSRKELASDIEALKKKIAGSE